MMILLVQDCSHSDRYRFGVNDTTVTMRISGLVYYDANNNGVRDAGEGGVATQQVLVGAEQLLDQRLTGAVF
jgi:hypothetical protein